MTDAYRLMFEDAIRTLAAIDDALELPEDGCNSPSRTLHAISELKKSASLGVKLAHAVMADNTGKS